MAASRPSSAPVTLEPWQLEITNEAVRKFAATLAEGKAIAERISKGAVSVLTSPEERDALFNLAKEGHEFNKKVEKVRKKLLEKPKFWTEVINGIAKEKLMEPINEAIDNAKGKMAKFDEEFERAQEEERMRQEEERQRREEENAAEARKIAAETSAAVAKSQEQAERYRREVIDPMEPGPEKAAALREWRATYDAEALRLEQEGQGKAMVHELVSGAEHGDIASRDLELDSDVGRGVSKRWTFEVTDLAALYKARPDLVKLEERRAMINSEIAAGVRDIDGIHIFEERGVALR